MNLKIAFMFFSFSVTVFAQDWQIAHEVWSKPVLLNNVLNLPFDWYDSPAFTQNMDTIYYTGGSGVYRAIKQYNNENTNWIVDTLNRKVNPQGQMPPISCPISRNGRRIYISNLGGYNGSRDIWRSDWDESLKDWGSPINMGGGINTPRPETFFYELSGDSAYVIANHVGVLAIYLYTFNKQNNDWAIADSFNNVYLHPFRRSDKWGLSITKNRKKMYFGQLYVRDNQSTSLTEAQKRYKELAVSYYDNTKKEWGTPFYLNINSRGFFPDSIKWPTFIAGGYDAYPWISEDGKVLVFASVRDVKIDSTGKGDEMPKLYISYLLKDENGLPVDVELDDNNNPTDFILFQNYPNPFNGSTLISYSLPRQEKVTIKIYDILGREMANIVNGEQSEGVHTISFNPVDYHLASGMYVYQMCTSKKQLIKNMLYLK